MARKNERPAPLPCPCGRLPVVTKIRTGRYVIACSDLRDCGYNLAVFRGVKDEAVIAWNEEVRKHDAVRKGH